MKLKKGSPEAKKIMAKLRAKKKKSIGISRSDKQYNKEVELYKYFVIDIQANRIISGWEYLSDAKDFINDFFTKSNFKIVPKSKLKTLNLSNSIEDFKNSIGGWAKGNTRMIEMDEKPFKKLKNVRVKRRKDGVFNSFKVIPNMEQFIKDKRKFLSGDSVNTKENSNIDFFEKNRIEYNKYNHLEVYRNYRGKDKARLNDKIVSLKKAYFLIDKGDYKYYTQTNLGTSLIVQYRKLK
jgi:hypothetical protein